MVVRGLQMHARISEGPAGRPAVILVHGLVISGLYMVPTAELLAPHYQIYVPDLPGFGESEKPRTYLDVEGLSEALARWMGAAGLKRAALVGNSFGCQVIADLIARRPNLVERAVLQGPTIDPQRRSTARQVWRFLINSPLEPLSLSSIMLRDYARAGSRRAIATVRYALRDKIEEKLPHIQVPTLVVRGSRDAIVPQRWAEETVRLLPDGRLTVISGAAHTLNYSAPQRFARVIRTFLDE